MMARLQQGGRPLKCPVGRYRHLAARQDEPSGVDFDLWRQPGGARRSTNEGKYGRRGNFAPLTSWEFSTSTSGVDEELGVQLRRAGKLDLDSTVHLVPAAALVGASTEQARASARAWLGSMRSDPPLMESE
jgi:hypothetical protein